MYTQSTLIIYCGSLYALYDNFVSCYEVSVSFYMIHCVIPWNIDE